LIQEGAAISLECLGADGVDQRMNEPMTIEPAVAAFDQLQQELLGHDD